MHIPDPSSTLSVVLAGGGSAGHVNPLLATADALRAVSPEWVRETVLPLLADQDRLAQMGAEAAVMGNRDAADVLADMVLSAAGRERA